MSARLSPTKTPPPNARWREQPADAQGGAELLALMASDDAQALMDFAYGDDRFLEFALMQGVAEPVQHHPEGDVGAHMRLVMNRAFELSAGLDSARKLRVRAAALCHDLGKVVTGGQRPLPAPDGRWLPFDAKDPHHPGHDHMGIGLSRALFSRLSWPAEMWEFVAQFAMWHQSIHQLCDRQGQFGRGSATLANNLAVTPKGDRWGLPAIRLSTRDEAFAQDFAMAAQSDAQGRLMTPEQMAYPQARFLLLAAEKARAAAEPFAGQEIDDRFIFRVSSAIREAVAQWGEEVPQTGASGFKPPVAPREHKPRPEVLEFPSTPRKKRPAR